jgi:hypothetical protein
VPLHVGAREDDLAETAGLDRGFDGAGAGTEAGLENRSDLHAFRVGRLENPNANPNAKVFLYQTWTRPDLAYLPTGEYFGEPLETMADDLRESYALAATVNPNIAGVFPVGEAFMRAVQAGVAHRNSYAPEGNLVDLWWHEDQFHSSKYGSYLSALVIFGQLSGIDPTSFGGNEKAANDLGIEPQQAMRLQRVAAEQLAASGVTTDRRNCLHANANSHGARACSN